MTLGIDANRLTMLLAVLERRATQHVLDKDVFLNVAGGLRLRETAADLPAALAVVSALHGRPLPSDVAVFGEVGLSGEVRSVDRAVQRLREVQQLGFQRCLVAGANLSPEETPEGLQVIAVQDVAEAVTLMFGG
jgi:DNA repair protein RadA/Sms